MTAQPQAAPVTTEAQAEAPAGHAFRVFTEGIGSGWNPGHHILRAGLAEMVFEPCAGRHIVDRGTGGSQCRWARILACDPPHRACFGWDINRTAEFPRSTLGVLPAAGQYQRRQAEASESH